MQGLTLSIALLLAEETILTIAGKQKLSLIMKQTTMALFAGTVSYKIEELTDSRFILSSYAANGNLQFKTEYLRFD